MSTTLRTPEAPPSPRATPRRATAGSPTARARPLFDPPIVRRALADAVRKLAPRHMVRNPVMLVVYVGAAYTTLALVADWRGHVGEAGFLLQLTLWLWFTVLFANFAEAMAEGRGKAQADTLRHSRTQTRAKQLRGAPDQAPADRTA
ncbi:MAG: potassium-transporting ATPase subunit B, partial [Gemmatimonadota bacterium]|nr:potassium-transporting ATPase subunit B [Gemmatimonadota bacterium]